MDRQSLDILEGLNPAQKAAVTTIEGPVMVIAGPGTGKTTVLTKRIAYIRIMTDVEPESILCLTFTNTAVAAMRSKLRGIMGSDAARVRISTFHSFAHDLVSEYYSLLGFEKPPTLLDTDETTSIYDYILHAHSWEYLRPRSQPAQYFNEIKSRISLFKRERISPDSIESMLDAERERIANDPDNISSRGPTKGSLKASVRDDLEKLKRTTEVAQFYRYLQEYMRAECLMDYDDMLSLFVQLVVEHEDIAATVRERYLYVLVDEHQDSSNLQNEFLRAVWGECESPNVFVVGDDRQIIFGFSGASLSQFQGFVECFPDTTLITLTDNYRSSQHIVDVSSVLLRSEMVPDSITGHAPDNVPIRLYECEYPDDEISLSCLDIRNKIDSGYNPAEMAILVPRNRDVRRCVRMLVDRGIPVASSDSLLLFDIPETDYLRRVLSIIDNPMDTVEVAKSLFDATSGISPMEAHQWLSQHKSRALSVDMLVVTDDAFDSNGSVAVWGRTLTQWIQTLTHQDVYTVIQAVGNDLLIATAQDSTQLSRRVEILRTFLHHAESLLERNPRLSLSDFLAYWQRLQAYDQPVPLHVFTRVDGVSVMTMHASKGLEFRYVWIAHMNESVLANKRASPFMLPRQLEEYEQQRDANAIRRQIYVAMTRAKEICSVSYALKKPQGSALTLAHAISDIAPECELCDVSCVERMFSTNQDISARIPQHHTLPRDTIQDLIPIVARQFTNQAVSATLLNNFFTCPWMWYFRNIIRLPEPQNIPLLFGNVIHELIQEAINHPLLIQSTSLESMVDTVMNRHGNTHRVLHSYRDSAVTIMSRWTKDTLPTLSPERTSEKSYSTHPDEFPELLITGKIDLVEHIDSDRVRVTDFKTGKPKSTREIQDTIDGTHMSGYMRQLVMYAYLIDRSSRGSVFADELRLQFVESPDDQFYSTHATQEHFLELLGDIRDYYQTVVGGDWVTRPCSNIKRGTTPCPYCDLAKRVYPQLDND